MSTVYTCFLKQRQNQPFGQVELNYNSMLICFLLKVNLGVNKENPLYVVGIIRIVSRLQRYVPVKPDGSHHITGMHRDGLTIKRIGDARRAMACEPSSEGKLNGIEGVPQEFHKRALLLQVMDF